MIFGILTEGDTAPLKMKITELEFKLKIQEEKNEELKKRVDGLGREVALLRRQGGGDAPGFGITVH